MSDAPEEPLAQRVSRYQRREARAREQSVGSVWRTIGQVGALGWLIALPLVVGAWLGHLLDRELEGGVTFSLGGLALGLALGVYFLWRTIRDVHRDLEDS
ncbi:MAG: AtpZ/AtpI family protein [Planctomycetota bacterium]